MHLPAAHVEKSKEALQDFVSKNPLGLLVTHLELPQASPLQATHVPFVFDKPAEGQEGAGLGVLRGHLARSNPQAKALVNAALDSSDQMTAAQNVLIVFTGPHHSYVPPRFYTTSKPATQKVVPTWNYSTAHAYGTICIHHDMASQHPEDFLARQIEDLTTQQEDAVNNPGGKPWKVSDAPPGYIKILKRAIVGIEITLHSLEGKHKMSQEMPRKDAEGVAQGFAALGTDGGRHLSSMVAQLNANR